MSGTVAPEPAVPGDAGAADDTPPMRPSGRRRVAAVVTLIGLLALTAEIVVFPIRTFPGGLIAGVAIVVVGGAGWFALRRKGLARTAGMILALVALAVAVVALVSEDAVLDLILLGGVLAITLTAREIAFRPERDILADVAARRRRVGPAQHGVLIVNPRSGGGKAAKARLAEIGPERGIEVVELVPGNDLRVLAEDAVARGADVLGMAGGDGSQALVATVAANHGLPFVCIPAGTRNHLALDLGVDREDVVGSLDAYGEAIERDVDLAEVNGEVFVNNVSLGVYARIVQSEAYRDAKLRTTLDLLPELIGPGRHPFDFSVADSEGHRHENASVVLVSNNPYLLNTLFGLGSRPRLNTGELGVVVARVERGRQAATLAGLEAAGSVRRYRALEEWAAPEVEIEAGGELEAGIDGEARVLEAPLRFSVRPKALRVRLAPQHPGVSPAYVIERTGRQTLRGLLRLAAGRPPNAPDPAASRPRG